MVGGCRGRLGFVSVVLGADYSPLIYTLCVCGGALLNVVRSLRGSGFCAKPVLNDAFCSLRLPAVSRAREAMLCLDLLDDVESE